MTRRAITFTVTIPLPAAPPLLAGGRRGLARLRHCLDVWEQRSAERRELSRMNAHQLHDIGVRADEARREVQKPFWRA
jgi:uncharacterized protein YjiS (DUF1127 family)